MMDRGSIVLFRIRGIPVRAHWTLLLVLPYLAIVLSVQFRSVAEAAGVDDARLVLPPLVWGALLALGLFASICLHELAHTFVALRYGGQVRSITLMLLGGVSHVSRFPERPRAEALMALAGPATSLALGGALLLLYGASDTWPADARMGLFYLATTNVVLGVFNLLPAFPMDGGRILRAALASRRGRAAATRAAAAVGKVCAVAMGLVGLWAGNFLLVLIAVFVYSGATGEANAARVRAALDGLRVADLVPLFHAPPPTIDAGAPLADVLPRMQQLGRLELLAVDERGAPAGVITAADLVDVPPNERTSRRIAELLARRSPHHVTVPWQASANDALERAADASAPYVLVTDEQGVVALLAASDIGTMVELRLAAEEPSPRRTPPRIGLSPR